MSPGGLAAVLDGTYVEVTRLVLSDSDLVAVARLLMAGL
jgi:hypothetical protein